MIKISGIDHFVLTVKDIEATCAFYERVLGMEVVAFGPGNGRRALLFGNQRINLHQTGLEFEPNAEKTIPGSADFCLITETPLA